MFGFNIRISGDMPAVADHVEGHNAHLQELVRSIVSHLQEHGLAVGSAQLNGRDVAPLVLELDPEPAPPSEILAEGSTRVETQPLRVIPTITVDHIEVSADDPDRWIAEVDARTKDV